MYPSKQCCCCLGRRVCSQTRFMVFIGVNDQELGLHTNIPYLYSARYRSPSVHFEETIGQTAFPASPFRPLWARRGFRQWTSSYRRPSFADAMMSRMLRRSFLCCGLDPVCISIFMSDPPRPLKPRQCVRKDEPKL